MRDRTLLWRAFTAGLLVLVLPSVASARTPPMRDASSPAAGARTMQPERASTSAASAQEEVYRVRVDMRVCPAPFCGGAFVTRVNHPETLCADVEIRESCYVTRVDLELTDLTDPQLSHVQSALNRGQVLLVGRIEQVFSPTWGLGGEFRATEVWRSATDAVTDGVVFRVRDNGVRCVAAPCYSYRVESVNAAEVMLVSEVHLANVGATVEMLAAAAEALSTTGILVTGTMHDMPGAGPAGDGRRFDATQFYIPITRGIMIPPIR